jgi:glycosyltransferase involved in cell wall biosynthesis
MRILHLSTTDILGGAARGAFWLHSALRRRGVDSVMLVDRKYGDSPSVRQRSEFGGRIARRLRSRLDTLPLRRYRRSGDAYWTVGWVPSGVSRSVRSTAADIVHMHWIGGGFVSVGALPRFHRPMVWTLRDMWSFTGGCHHTPDCNRFENSCGMCPQLQSQSTRDLSRQVWERKHRHWHDLDISLVAISTWLAECAQRSSLFRDRRIEVIPNGVDVRRFRPMDKGAARRKLGLPPHKRLILFGAIDPIRDSRKGFHYFKDAVGMLATNGRADDTEVVVFGAADETALQGLALPSRSVGHLDDDETLAVVYAAADVMAAPVVGEPFGKTLIEAMACGTPVVAFDVGGPRDIVEHQATGFLVPELDARGIAEGIGWCLGDAGRTAALGRSARSRVETKFDIDVVAARYCKLYEEILAREP